MRWLDDHQMTWSRIHITIALVTVAIFGQPVRADTGLLAESLAGILARPDVQCGNARLDRARLAPYYGSVSPAPLWVTEHGPDARAQLLIAALQRMDQEGLVA